MKPLIVTIVLAILTIYLTGCVEVRGYNHGHASRAVVVTHPRHLPIGPRYPHRPYAHQYMERRNHHRFRRMHR